MSISAFLGDVIHVLRVLSAIYVTQNQQTRFLPCTELHVWLSCSSSAFLSHPGMAEGGLQTTINSCCCNGFKGTFVKLTQLNTALGLFEFMLGLSFLTSGT